MSGAGAKPMLELDRLCKRYRGATVIDEVSLAVPVGETLVLFGPSGAGKTVLLRMIAGVVEPDAGRLWIDGQDMAGVDPEARGVGMAFQNFALFPHMTAERNIASSLEMTERSKDKLAAAVKRVATLLKIDHVLGHAPRALSNGQKQRTALARALVGSPKLLLLDDPLRNVDAKLRFEMRLELPALLAREGTTVVYVTQDYKEAMALGDRIAVMEGGTIRQYGTAEDVYRRPATIDIARQFGDPTINLLEVVPDVVDGRCGVPLSGIRLPIDAAFAPFAGRPGTLGLRPESLSLLEPGAADTVPVTIEAVTPLNEKVVTLVLTKNGREILVSRPAGTPGPADGAAGLRIDPDGILLFERDGGARIAPDTLAEAA